MVYVEQLTSINVSKMRFDPAAGKTQGELISVTQGARDLRFGGPVPSPDGEFLAVVSAGQREDIRIIKTDGTGVSRLTDDDYRDRWPNWSPDSKKIVFASNRSGHYEIYTVNRDGSDLRQLTETAPAVNPLYPVWSPDGSRIAYFSGLQTLLIEVNKPWKEQTPQPLPPVDSAGTVFEGWSWSPDGRFLAGRALAPSGTGIGTLVYDFETKQFEKLTDRTARPFWLNDNRRLLFALRGTLYLIDRQTKKPIELLSNPQFIGLGGVSKDNRDLYFRVGSTTSELWMISLP